MKRAIKLHKWGSPQTVTIIVQNIRGIYRSYEGTVIELVGEDEIRVRESVQEIYQILGG
jgi:hypothetical protein